MIGCIIRTQSRLGTVLLDPASLDRYLALKFGSQLILRSSLFVTAPHPVLSSPGMILVFGNGYMIHRI